MEDELNESDIHLSLHAVISHDVILDYMDALNYLNPTVEQLVVSLIGTWVINYDSIGKFAFGLIDFEEDVTGLYTSAFFYHLVYEKCIIYQVVLEKIRAFQVTFESNYTVLTLYADEGTTTNKDQIEFFVATTVKAVLNSVYCDTTKGDVISVKEIDLGKFPFKDVCYQLSPKFDEYLEIRKNTL